MIIAMFGFNNRNFFVDSYGQVWVYQTAQRKFAKIGDIDLDPKNLDESSTASFEEVAKS